VALTATAGGLAAVTTNPNLTNVLSTAADAQATLSLINSAVAKHSRFARHPRREHQPAASSQQRH